MWQMLVNALWRHGLITGGKYAQLLKYVKHYKIYRKQVELYEKTTPKDAKHKLHILFFGGKPFAELPFLVKLQRMQKNLAGNSMKKNPNIIGGKWLKMCRVT